MSKKAAAANAANQPKEAPKGNNARPKAAAAKPKANGAKPSAAKVRSAAIRLAAVVTVAADTVDITQPAPGNIDVPMTGIYVRAQVTNPLRVLGVYAAAYSGTTAPTPSLPLTQDPADSEFYEGFLFAPCGYLIRQRFSIKVLAVFMHPDGIGFPPILADDTEGPYFGRCLDFPHASTAE